VSTSTCHTARDPGASLLTVGLLIDSVLDRTEVVDRMGVKTNLLVDLFTIPLNTGHPPRNKRLVSTAQSLPSA
jgi:hypothetical protein